jgi:hypothetical protein
MRYSLSTHTDGSYLPIDINTSTLVHREDANSGTRYIRIIGFNRGQRARNISFSFNDVEALYATVQPTGNPQILIPDIPIYNNGIGLDIYSSLKQSVFAWILPQNIEDTIVLDQGRVVGLDTSTFTVDSSAQPLLVHVSDSRRSNTDVDPSKGSEAIIEIYQTNGSIAVEVVEAGYNFESGSLRVSLKSAVYIYGDIFSD